MRLSDFLKSYITDLYLSGFSVRTINLSLGFNIVLFPGFPFRASIAAYHTQIMVNLRISQVPYIVPICMQEVSDPAGSKQTCLLRLL